MGIFSGNKIHSDTGSGTTHCGIQVQPSVVCTTEFFDITCYDCKQAARKLWADAMLKAMNERIDANSPEENREDLRMVIVSVVGFFAKENPKIFRKGQPVEYNAKEFFKTLGGIALSAGTGMGGKEMGEKFKDFMGFLPIISKYADDEQE